MIVGSEWNGNGREWNGNGTGAKWGMMRVRKNYSMNLIETQIILLISILYR